MTPRKLTDNYVATLVDDEVVIVDMAAGQLFSLKDTGRAIWELIDGERSCAEIAEDMAESHEIDVPAAQRSVAALLGELEEAGLIAC